MTGSRLDQTLPLTVVATDVPDDCTPGLDDAAGAPSARFALRTVTESDHLATEAAFAPFDIVAPEHYRRFLLAHAMVLPRFELGVTGQGWRDWHPRLPYLADDLAALGEELPRRDAGARHVADRRVGRTIRARRLAAWRQTAGEASARGCAIALSCARCRHERALAGVLRRPRCRSHARWCAVDGRGHRFR